MNDSSHWYDRETGEARHTTIGSNGKERPTTLREAKKFGYLPSCTTILKVLAKPELDRWKQKQVLLASLTLPRLVDESDESYCDRIIEDAFKQVDDAADLGTRIHKAIELHFQGHAYDPELKDYIESVEKWVESNGITFISHEHRVRTYSYAGTTDGIITASGREGTGICDFKTRKSNPKYPMKSWATEPLQIAAYANGGKESFGVNIFISTTEPGRIEATWYDSQELNSNYEVFVQLYRVWCHLNKYTPHNFGQLIA